MDRTISGTDELRSVQLRKLTTGLDQVLRSNSFWRERLRALTIPGGAMTTEQRIGVIEELRPTVFLCTPTYALRLADVAAQMGVDLAASSIRVTIHAGEAGASIPATREAIETAFGATCVDHSGMTELGPTGFSCTQRDGLHLVESEFIFEVL